jgi:hypothetical protein
MSDKNNKSRRSSNIPSLIQFWERKNQLMKPAKPKEGNFAYFSMENLP